MLSPAHARDIIELLDGKRPEVSPGPPSVLASPDAYAKRAHLHSTPAGTPAGRVVSARTQRGGA